MKAEPIDFCPLCGYDAMGTRPCRACAQPIDDIDYRSIYNYCPKCGLFFQQPMWYTDYENEYYEMQRKLDPTGLNDARTQALRAMKLVDFIASTYGVPETVLDIGSGLGSTLAIARGRFKCNVMGVEPCTEARSNAKVSDGIESVPSIKDLPEGDWELIVCSHVLEHTNDPHTFVAQLPSRKIGQQTLVLEVPNGFAQHAGGIWHPIMWTTSTLTRLFRERGWDGPMGTHTHGWPTYKAMDAYLSMIFWR